MRLVEGLSRLRYFMIKYHKLYIVNCFILYMGNIVKLNKKRFIYPDEFQKMLDNCNENQKFSFKHLTIMSNILDNFIMLKVFPKVFNYFCIYHKIYVSILIFYFFF